MIRIGETYHLVVPNHVEAFSAWPGDECEVANLGLAHYPETIDTAEGTVTTGLNGWMTVPKI